MTVSTGDSANDRSLVREQIIADPGIVLDDAEVLKAIASVHNDQLGDNVIDGRGLAFGRLEQKLRQAGQENQLLKEVLRENAEAMQRTHHAVLKLLEIEDLQALSKFLSTELPTVMRVESVVLLPNGPNAARLLKAVPDAARGSLDPVVRRAYIEPFDSSPGRILLRQISKSPAQLYGSCSPPIRSEALLPVSIDDASLAFVLVIGSSCAENFKPGMSTELLDLVRRVVATTVGRLAA